MTKSELENEYHRLMKENNRLKHQLRKVASVLSSGDGSYTLESVQAKAIAENALNEAGGQKQQPEADNIGRIATHVFKDHGSELILDVFFDDTCLLTVKDIEHDISLNHAFEKESFEDFKDVISNL